jgi:TDG/mug DNA glycosylase family protein
MPGEHAMTDAWRPSRHEIVAARARTVPDVIAPHLHVLFCGINPGLYSAAIGHHFGRPGNRFWAALCGAGFTDRLLSPFDDRDLLKYGLGVTNLAARATAAANELTDQELIDGGRKLARKVDRYRPSWVAFVGVMAYRTAFGRQDAALGQQPETMRDTRIWVLPNPSGLNAHYNVAALGRLFAALRRAALRKRGFNVLDRFDG